MCVLLCVGCSSLESQKKPTHGVPNDSEPNEIFFGQQWPTGSTFVLSDRQAKRLREIVWGTEIDDPFSKLPEGMTVSPASDFSYFTIYGKGFHFIPPSTPHDFRLTAAKQRMLDRFMADEFGMTGRWQTPKPKGEQLVGGNGG